MFEAPCGAAQSRSDLSPTRAQWTVLRGRSTARNSWYHLPPGLSPGEFLRGSGEYQVFVAGDDEPGALLP
jgi:hypothetical protein